VPVGILTQQTSLPPAAGVGPALLLYKTGFAGNKATSGESFGNIPVLKSLSFSQAPVFGNYGLCFRLKPVTCQTDLISITEESNLTQLISFFLSISTNNVNF